MLKQQAHFRLGLGVAREDEVASVGGGQVDVEHLDRGELFQHGSGREARRGGAESLAQRDVEAVSQKRHEDVRLNAVFPLMINRAQREVAFEVFERLLNLRELQIKFPERGGILLREVAAQ